MGRNPAWIIPRIQAFLAARPGQRVRYVGEPIWAGRSAAEVREAARHEALINQAFGPARASILCPYDVARLAGQVLADAGRTHPELQHGPAVTPSPAYRGAALPPEFGLPLPPPPAGAETFRFRRDLAWVRALISGRARAAGLPPRRVRDLVLAAGELTANSIRHAGGSGSCASGPTRGSSSARWPTAGTSGIRLPGGSSRPRALRAGTGCGSCTRSVTW